MVHDPSPAEKPTFALIVFLGLLMALGALSNDLFVASLPLAAGDLGTSNGDIQLAMTAVLSGFALGQLFYGPLSDRFGRRPLLFLGLSVFVLASLLCSAADTLADLLLGRFLQGLGGAAGMVLARALILDRSAGSGASRVLSLAQMIAFMVPVSAPIIGGYIASRGDWTLVFRVHAFIGALCLLSAFLLLSSGRGPRAGSSLSQSLLGYLDVLKNRDALLYLACMGFGQAGVMAFVTNSAFVFINTFGLEPQQYGYCFSIVMLGGVTGSYLNGRLVMSLGISRLLSIGTALVAVAGVAALSANLLGDSVLAVLIPSLCYMFGMGLLFSNTIAEVLSRFRDRAGAAAAVVGVTQFLVGAIVATLMSLNETPTALPLTGALAAGGVASFVVWRLWLKPTETVSE